MRSSIAAIVLGLVALGCGPARASLPDGFPHQDLHWSVLTTQHFRLIYHEGLANTARTVAYIAEGNYDRVVASVGAAPTRRTDIVLAEYSQQTREFSQQLEHTIFLLGNSLNDAHLDQTTWLNLVVHEFAHVCTYYAIRGGGPIASAWEWFTAPLVPGWLYEGIAESEENRYSQLAYSVLRSAVLEDRLPPLAAIDTGTDRTLWDLWLKYAMGQSMVAYMVEIGGPDAVRRVLREYQNFPSINKAIRETLGMTYNEFDRRWRAWVTERYRRLLRKHVGVGSHSRSIPVDAAIVRSARLSPDGKLLAYTAIRDQYEPSLQLFVSNADGTGPRLISSDVDLYKSAAFSWSPDSSKLAYGRYWAESDGKVGFGVYVHDLASGRGTRITGEGNAIDPAWSPDGQSIALVRSEGFGETSRLVVVRPDGRDPRVLTAGEGMPGNVFRPAWSPDGERLCFEIAEGGAVNLATIAADGAPESLVALTNDEHGYNRSPSWSPDGRSIAFVSYRDGLPAIWVLEPEAGVLRRVSQEAVRTLFEPAWTPDGSAIAVASWGCRDADLRLLDARVSFSQEAWTLPSQESLAFRSDASAEARYASVDASGWTTSGYDSWDGVKTFLVRPNIVSDAWGLQPSIRAFAQDPVGKHVLAAELSWSLPGHAPGYQLEYRNSQHRWTWTASATRRLSGPWSTVAGTSFLDSDRAFALRTQHVGYTADNTRGRETWEFGLGWRDQSLHQYLSGTTPAPRLSRGFLEARYARSKLEPADGNESWQVSLRSGLFAGPSATRDIDVSASWQRTNSFAGRRRTLTWGLEGRSAALLTRGGGYVPASYLMPKVEYRRRLGDFVWGDMWPHLWLDQLTAGVSWRYYAPSGTSLLNYAPGHILRAELTGTGHVTHAVPYEWTLAAEYQSGAAAGSRLRYWLTWSTDAVSVFRF